MSPIGFGQPSGDTDLLEQEQQQDLPTEDGDHEKFSHYVPKDKLTEAMIEGTPVIALCGKVWVPSRSPERYQVCPECKEIWAEMNPGDEGGE